MNLYQQKKIIVEKLKSIFINDEELQKSIFYPFPNYLDSLRVKNPYSLFENNPTLGVDGKEIKPNIYLSASRIPDLTNETGIKIIITTFERAISNRINSMTLSIVFTVLIHNTCIITEYSDDRFNEIFERIDEKLNGNFYLSDGYTVVSKGTRVLKSEASFERRTLIYEVPVTFTHDYGKNNDSDKFEGF